MRSNDRDGAGQPPKPTTLVIGIGNEERGDDAVGLLIARRLAALGLDGVSVITEQREGLALIDAWERAGAAQVILIDAVISGAPPGTVRRLPVDAEPLPLLDARTTSHSLGVAQAVELARTLGRLPVSLVVYAVEGRQFTLGAPPSPEVARAIDQAVDAIRAEIA